MYFKVATSVDYIGTVSGSSADLAKYIIETELDNAAARIIEEHSSEYGNWGGPWWQVPIPAGWKFVAFRLVKSGLDNDNYMISLDRQDESPINMSDVYQETYPHIIVSRIRPKKIVFTQISTTPRRAEAGEWYMNDQQRMMRSNHGTDSAYDIFSRTEE